MVIAENRRQAVISEVLTSINMLSVELSFPCSQPTIVGIIDFARGNIVFALITATPRPQPRQHRHPNEISTNTSTKMYESTQNKKNGSKRQ